MKKKYLIIALIIALLLIAFFLYNSEESGFQLEGVEIYTEGDKYSGYLIGDNTFVSVNKETGEESKLDLHEILSIAIDESLPEDIKEEYEVTGIEYIDLLDLVEVTVFDAINNRSRTQTDLIFVATIDGSKIRLLEQVSTGVELEYSNEYTHFVNNSTGVDGRCTYSVITVGETSPYSEQENTTLLNLSNLIDIPERGHIQYYLDRWVSDNSLRFNIEVVSLNDCFGAILSKQAWEYNVETEEYTLVSEDE